jgi:predicted transcriptional regulator
MATTINSATVRPVHGLPPILSAQSVDSTPETLNRLEQGKHTPTMGTINKIDRALLKAEKE